MKEFMNGTQDRQAVVVSTHNLDSLVEKVIGKLVIDLSPDKYDIILLFNTLSATEKISGTFGERLFVCDVRELNKLGYRPITDTLFPGSCHFPLLKYYLENSDYNHYWFVEYDVCFTGNWSLLMDDCSENLGDYDFLSCHVETYDPKRNADWSWWYRHNDVGYPLSQCVKGFNPICRYSNRALSYIDRYQKEGHSAHSEVMITTCLHNAGFKIGDLGGTGEFTPDGWRNKYYVQGIGVNNGTMRWRPEFSREEIEALGTRNKLFHPLKG